MSARHAKLLLVILALETCGAYALQRNALKLDAAGKSDAQGHDTKEFHFVTDEATMLQFRHFQQFLEWQEHREEFMQWRASSAQGLKGKAQENYPPIITDIWDVIMWSPVIAIVLLFVCYGLRPTVHLTCATIMFALKLVYNFYLGVEHFDTSHFKHTDDPLLDKSKRLHKRVETEGIAWPANALWRKTYGELTTGQIWVLSTVGIRDEKHFNVARTYHSGSPLEDPEDLQLYESIAYAWASMTHKQRHALKLIGFTKASWDNDGQNPMQIHEKRWTDVSEYERQQATTLMISQGIEAASLADAWDTRAADIFYTKFGHLPESDRTLLKSLGFGKDRWIAYDDPIPPLEFTHPGWAATYKWIKKSIICVLTILIVWWALWMCMKFGILSTMTGMTIVYVVIAFLVAGAFILGAYALWELILMMEESLLSEVRVVFQHLKDVWQMLHKLTHVNLQGVSEKIKMKRQETMKKVNKHCACGGCTCERFNTIDLS